MTEDAPTRSNVGNDEAEEEYEDDDNVVITTERPDKEYSQSAWEEGQQQAGDQETAEGNHGEQYDQTQMNGEQNFDYNQNGNNTSQNFNNMDFNSMNGFNPMMPGMQSGAMGGMPGFGMMPNMMGESRFRGRYDNYIPQHRLKRPSPRKGMMDPSMMFGGGFGGDMSMMNMGMGGNFGGMGGGFNGGGMGMGGGNAPPGFFPGNGGYNQHSNFHGNNMHQNFHNNRGYGGNRPYGRGGFNRGRGWNDNFGGRGRGRGGWQNQNYNQNQQGQGYMNQNQQQQQQPRQQQGQHQQDGNIQAEDTETRKPRGSPSYEPMNGATNTTTEDANMNIDQPDTGNGEEIGNTGEDPTTNNADEAAHDNTDNKDKTPKPETKELDQGMIDSFLSNPEFARVAAAWVAPFDDRCMTLSAESVCSSEGAPETNDGSASMEISTVSGAEKEQATVTDTGNYNDYGHGSANGGAMQEGGYGDQGYQQELAYGSRGHDGLGGGARGGGYDRGRGGGGGAYGYGITLAGEAEGPTEVAPPVNAPTGPKAMRKGLPNSGFYSRPQNQQPKPVTPAPMSAGGSAVKMPTPAPDVERERSRSYERSNHGSRRESRRESVKERGDEVDGEDEYKREKDRERRKRKERESKYEDSRDGHESSRKGRSRSASPSDDHSRRRHHGRDDEHRSSRSHRDKSRDKHKRRHRSRSRDGERSSSINGRNEGTDYESSSRRKSKSDRRHHRSDDYDDYDRTREKDKTSRRSSKYEIEEPNYESKDRPAKHNNRSSKSDHRDHRPVSRAVLEEPNDDIGFKIKGTKSASIRAPLLDTTMAPPPARERGHRRSSGVQRSTPQTPSATTPTTDPYAEERERRQRERLDRENTLRRGSSQSLGKRVSRDDGNGVEEAVGAPRETKKARRKMAVKVSGVFSTESMFEDGLLTPTGLCLV